LNGSLDWKRVVSIINVTTIILIIMLNGSPDYVCPQATCREGLYGDGCDPQENAVPVSNEEHMVTLRAVLREADRRDRVQRRNSERRRAAPPH
jgi:hypothetical protein